MKIITGCRERTLGVRVISDTTQKLSLVILWGISKVDEARGNMDSSGNNARYKNERCAFSASKNFYLTLKKQQDQLSHLQAAGTLMWPTTCGYYLATTGLFSSSLTPK